MKENIRINEEIDSQSVRLVLEDKSNTIIPTNEAIAMARSMNLDLVEIVPNSLPSICKIISYEKYIYALQKQQKTARKKNKVLPVKEVKLSLTIDNNDFMVKLNNVLRFIKEGHKVILSIFLKFKEKNIWNKGIEELNKIIDELGDKIRVEQSPKQEKRKIFALIAPASKKNTKKPLKHNDSENSNDKETEEEHKDIEEEDNEDEK